jgi:transposase-like protein
MPGLRWQGYDVRRAIEQYPDATCEQIARLVGTSRNTVSRWRNLMGLEREPHPRRIGWERNEPRGSDSDASPDCQ